MNQLPSATDNTPNLIFKAFQSSDEGTTNPSADRVWIHPRGDVAVIIDGVSGTGAGVRAAENCIEFLDEYSDLALNNAESLMRDLHDYLQSDNLQAVAGVVRWRDKTFELIWSGNLQLYTIDTLRQRISTLIPAETQPLHALGMAGPPQFQTATFEVRPDSFYLFATDGIDFHTLRANVHMPSASLPSLQWAKLARSAARESDWTLLTFPVETQYSFAHTGWPYDPFIGPQEDRDHERRGLAKIADAMFKESDFEGFYIAGGYRLFTENAMRRIDGVLVSPWGVVLLELKDHRGVITLDPTNRNCGLVKQVDGHESIETNPVNKLDEGLIAFKNCNLGAAIDTRLRNIGAVVFTHPQAQVTCFHPNKPRTMLPTRQGNILIVSPATLPDQLRRFVQCAMGKHASAPLSPAKCRQIAQSLTRQARPPRSDTGAHKTIGRYTFRDEQLDPTESTSYYQMYKGHDTRLDRLVWLKRFQLSQLTRGEPDHEEERIAREMIALQDLDATRVDGVQKFFEKIRQGADLYLVLEYIDGPRLDHWLQAQPSRDHRLALLRQLAAILEALEPRHIVHRALSPANIRLAPETNQPILVNFELCRLEYLGTLPVAGRRLFDSQYQAQETNQPGGIVTSSADIYSFGKIACLVLAGELPFGTYHDQVRVARQPGFWAALGERCGLNSAGAKALQTMLAPNPARRPKAAELRELVAAWR